MDAISNIGYSFEAAVADLVDNSVDAKASHVLIRFIRKNDELLNLLVIDNGEGIASSKIDDAMTFAEQRHYSIADLGMYGMGLKSASLSQCGSLTVVSRRQKDTAVGRQWTTAQAKDGWRCGVVAQESVNHELNRSTPPEINLRKRGTIVRWDDVRDFKRAEGRVDKYLSGLTKNLVEYLGLHFHRFLSSGSLRIKVDSVNLESGETGIPTVAQPLDPFAHQVSGDDGYPKTFQIVLPEIDSLEARAHIWPPRSKTPEYRLGTGKVSGRQGFYFYRHDRLIQAGGWNLFRGDDAEPHLSLARVAIDLSDLAAKFFSVRFNKAGVDAPRTFVDAIRGATASDGTTFDEYIAAAIDAYRTKAEPTLRPVLAMGKGVRAEIKAIAEAQLPVLTNQKAIDFEWAVLPQKEFFKLDRDGRRLLINKRHRATLLGGKSASGADSPVLKTLLYLVTEEAFKTQRVSEVERKTLAAYSRLLTVAADVEGKQ